MTSMSRRAAIVYTQWLQRARRHRGRPHRHAPGRGPASWSSPAPRRRRATSPGCKRHMPGRCALQSRPTSPRACRCSALMGPNSRARCWQKLSGADLSNAAFPFGTSQRDRDRLCPGARQPHHLCRRAGLGALCPGRVRAHVFDTHHRSRRAIRPQALPACMR